MWLQYRLPRQLCRQLVDICASTEKFSVSNPFSSFKFESMSLLNKLADQNVWVDFYEKKVAPTYCRMSDAQELFQYVRQRRYLPIVKRIIEGKSLSVPKKKRIAKSDSAKKRIVYSLPEDEAMVLKLLTWLIIRKYDRFFSDSLYSFRPNYSAKDALKRLIAMPDISEYYSYKLDVSNYFNSIDVEHLLPMLKALFADDKPLYDFFESTLIDPRVIDEGTLIEEKKGVMAGMPYAVFFANVFLTGLDRHFESIPGVMYCRYSDDIIIFSKDKQTLENVKFILQESLDKYNLAINHNKEVETSPGEPWTFLGFECDGKDIDVSRVSVQKLKAKMRRKARAINRWRESTGKEDWMAAKAFIKHFNKKLYTLESSSEVNWAWWYFPLITTDKSLKEIDKYMQDCIRYVATGSRTKSRFYFRYEQMKKLDYCSLVNQWYRHKTAATNL